MYAGLSSRQVAEYESAWSWKLRQKSRDPPFWSVSCVDKLQPQGAKLVLERAAADNPTMCLVFKCHYGSFTLRWTVDDTDTAAKAAVERAIASVAESVAAWEVGTAVATAEAAAELTAAEQAEEKALLAAAEESAAEAAVAAADSSLVPLPPGDCSATFANFAKRTIGPQFRSWVRTDTALFARLKHAVQTDHFRERVRERLPNPKAALKDQLRTVHNRALARCESLSIRFDTCDVRLTIDGLCVLSVTRTDVESKPLRGEPVHNISSIMLPVSAAINEYAKCRANVSPALSTEEARVILNDWRQGLFQDCVKEFRLWLLTPSVKFLFDRHGKTLITGLSSQHE